MARAHGLGLLVGGVLRADGLCLGLPVYLHPILKSVS